MHYASLMTAASNPWMTGSVTGSEQRLAKTLLYLPGETDSSLTEKRTQS